MNCAGKIGAGSKWAQPNPKIDFGERIARYQVFATHPFRCARSAHPGWTLNLFRLSTIGILGALRITGGTAGMWACGLGVYEALHGCASAGNRPRFLAKRRGMTACRSGSNGGAALTPWCQTHQKFLWDSSSNGKFGPHKGADLSYSR